MLPLASLKPFSALHSSRFFLQSFPPVHHLIRLHERVLNRQAGDVTVEKLPAGGKIKMKPGLLLLFLQ